jgi:predicted Fe-S protein YdhL (DUF1289 family)
MIDSPCIRKCALDLEGNYCIGCNRTVEEISNWRHYSETDKLKVIERITQECRSTDPINIK